MDLVPYWQVIVVTPETVIASVELAGIIMQVRTHNLENGIIDGTCLLRRRDAAVQRWETAAQSSDRRPICRLPYYRLRT